MSANAQLPIQLIVGLGNPGLRYEPTRHNAGYWYVDLLASRHGGTFRPESKFHGEACRIRVAGEECWLLKPGTFMNRSGRAVAAISQYFKIAPEQILVAHDELDLPPGVIRLKQGGGHAGHNGLRDIVNAIGGRDFWRLRIGIDRPVSSDQVVDYVLGRPSREDADAIESAIRAGEEMLPEMLQGEFQKVMHQLHTDR